MRKISNACGNCDGNPSKTNNNKGTVNQYYQNNDKESKHLYKKKARVVTNINILIKNYLYKTKCLPRAKWNQNSPCDAINKAAQARNQDFMWGGVNEAKVDQTTEMFFLFNFF